MALLTRLAAKHDAVAKPVAGFLVLAKQGSIKTITGLVMPTINLAASVILSPKNGHHKVYYFLTLWRLYEEVNTRPAVHR